MSDAQHAAQDRARLPRDDQDTGRDADRDDGRATGVGDDRPTADDVDRPVRDRPAGPAAEGGQVSGAGEISPGVADADAVPEDDVIEERRQHVIANHGADGTESGRTAAPDQGDDR